MTPTEPIDEFVEYYKQNNALPQTYSLEEHAHNRKIYKELFDKYVNNQSWFQEQCMKAGEELRQDLFKFNDIAPMPPTTRLPNTIEEATDFFKQTGHHPPFESQSKMPTHEQLKKEIELWKSAIHNAIDKTDHAMIKAIWFEHGYRAAMNFIRKGPPDRIIYTESGTPSYTSRNWLVSSMNLEGKLIDEILFGNKQTNQGNNAQNINQNQMKTGIPSITEQAAEAAHEANRRYCEMIGDKSQKPWGEAEEWQRESTRKGVRFKILNPDATPEDQHYEWCKTKYEDGWVYGPEKKPEEKIHNCLVPYSELPIEQRVKDLLFQVAIEPYIEEYKNLGKNPKYFEKALSWLKAFVADTGRDFAMARTGWNGKGLKVKLQIPDAFSKMSLPYLYLEYPSTPASDTAPANHINARVPWIPSQSDMMANDWVIIEPQETADAPTVDNSPTGRAPEPQGRGN